MSIVAKPKVYPGLLPASLGLFLLLAMLGIGGVWLFVGMWGGMIVQPLIFMVSGCVLGVAFGTGAIMTYRKSKMALMASNEQAPSQAGLIIGVILISKSVFVLVGILSTILLPLVIQSRTHRHRSTRTLSPRATVPSMLPGIPETTYGTASSVPVS